MVKFTAGILRSNIHRVVRPPGLQADETRHSLVYFGWPESDVVLKRLKCDLIDEQPAAEKEEEEITIKEWISRRGMGDLKGIYHISASRNGDLTDDVPCRCLLKDVLLL